MAYTTITDPSAYFQISTYDGNGSDDRNITYDGNSNMQPDWLWFKRRNQAVNHILFDSTRGVTSRIHSNNTNAAAIEANFLQAFNSNGFQVGTDADINGSGGTFVSWGWKANGGSTTTAAESGSNVGYTRQVNTTSGFAIIKYTGIGSAAAVIHGMGATPAFFTVKRLSGSGYSWYTYHHKNTEYPWTDNLYLNNTDGTTDNDTVWNDQAPSSTEIKIGTNAGVNADGVDYIMYAFAEKQGYSKFGSYTGNANEDGTFIYTGFKPRFIMIKGTGNVSSWNMYDTKRDPINRSSQQIKANSDAVEASTGAMDFLSNGIKMRTTDNDFNGNGYSYIYMAFAENPFVATNGVPTTAK